LAAGSLSKASLAEGFLDFLFCLPQDLSMNVLFREDGATVGASRSVEVFQCFGLNSGFERCLVTFRAADSKIFHDPWIVLLDPSELQ